MLQDTAMLRDSTGKGGNFDIIGTDFERKPLVLEEYMSYDEMQISALVGLSGPTIFINSGSRTSKLHSLIIIIRIILSIICVFILTIFCYCCCDSHHCYYDYHYKELTFDDQTTHYFYPTSDYSDRGAPGTFEEEGIYAALVGAR